MMHGPRGLFVFGGILLCASHHKSMFEVYPTLCFTDPARFQRSPYQRGNGGGKHGKLGRV